MKFRTQFEKQNRYVSASGTKEIVDYEKRLNSKGQTVVKPKTVKKNIYNRIQMHAGEDIKSMMKKLTKEEQKQFSTLAQIYKEDGEIYDLRDVPTSMTQALQMSKDTERKFKTLPMEVKQEFNNNFMEFKASAEKNDGNFETRMEKFYKKIENNQTTEQQTTTQTENTTKETL